DAEIERMRSEAAANADKDKKAKEEIDKLNGADAMIFSTEKNLKDYGDKLPADKKSQIESVLNRLKEAHKNKDLAGIDACMNEMNQVWQSVSQEMYNAQQQGQPGAGGNPFTGQQGSTGGPTGNAKDAEATDVDYEEVK
ncbi:MAG: Hsp70 family protein, partial [Bacteroidales bacterium]|nr:Hsp70 family protein [Bacteroidales bacterium]